MAELGKEYIPGVCNIGPLERRVRIQTGWIGLVVTLGLEGLFVLFRVPGPWRLALFFPAVWGAAGFLQAGFHFCLRFGLSGIYNLMNPAGVTDTVTQAEFRRLDRNKALVIGALSLFIAVDVAVAAWLTAA